MTTNANAIEVGWIDPDDAPPLDDPWFERAEVRIADKVVRRGRPHLDNPKLSVTLRLDADVVTRFREDGPGWQTRMNLALRKAAGL